MPSAPPSTRRSIIQRSPGDALGGLILAGRVDGARGAPPGRTVRFPSFGCTYLRRGFGQYRDERRRIDLGPGSLVFVFPGQPHWYGAHDGTWDELFLVFDGPLFRLAAERGLLDRERPVRRLEPVPYWTRKIDQFRIRPAPRSNRARDVEACDLLRLLVEIDAAMPSPRGHPGVPMTGTDWYARSVVLLESDLDQRVSMPAIAAEVGLPYETWRRSFQRRSGRSPARYRLERRLDAAEALLIETPLSVREIAAIVGFSDEQHLNRHVRAASGSTPRQFRRRNG